VTTAGTGHHAVKATSGGGKTKVKIVSHSKFSTTCQDLIAELDEKGMTYLNTWLELPFDGGIRTLEVTFSTLFINMLLEVDELSLRCP
jgi:hypothetical protein